MLRDEGIDLSEEFLHWAAKRIDNMPESEGTSLAAAATALNIVGQPPEETWPYDQKRDHHSPKYQPSSEATNAAPSRRLEKGRAITPKALHIREALVAGLAVMIGIQLHSTFYTPNLDGRIDMPKASLAKPGGHAVLVVGYLDRVEDGGGVFIIRNSWGVGWGCDGYAYLPFSYVDQYSMQSWCLGLTIAGAGDKFK